MRTRWIVVSGVVLVALAALTGVASCDGDAGTSEAPTADATPPDRDAVGDATDAARCPFPPSRAVVPKRPLAILLFTKETQFFHTAAHDAGEVSVPAALRSRGHTVVVTGDVATFTNDSLARFDVIVFFVTSGKVLVDPVNRAALQTFVRSGRGIAGAHTATATDLDWVDEQGRTFMTEMFGGAFKGHGAPPANVTEAGLVVRAGDDDASPPTAFLPRPWVRADEWYFYHVNPATRADVHTLVWLDESWLEPYRPGYPDEGFYGDAGHPISWTKEFECSRVFYTAMGHTGESWTEDLVLRHFVAGIEWAGAPSSEIR